MQSSRKATLALNRGPLRFVILAAIGVDVNRCAACGACYVDDLLQARFDLEIWEILVAACEDKREALTNQTIWALAEAQPKDVNCFNELDVVAVAQVLCREAQLRGLAPQPMGEDGEDQTYRVQCGT